MFWHVTTISAPSKDASHWLWGLSPVTLDARQVPPRSPNIEALLSTCSARNAFEPTQGGMSYTRSLHRMVASVFERDEKQALLGSSSASNVQVPSARMG